MNNNWQKVKLSEIIQLIGGGTPKTTNNTYWNGNIPWLSVVDFNDDNRYVTTTEKTITELGLQNSTTHLLDKGDIIISARGTVGALAQLATPMAFNQSCYGIKATERSCNDFLYYLLKNSIGKLKKNTHGSVFNTITRDTFSNIVVSIPPLDEQRKIAGILSALDDKIELNNKINRNLEAQAQAIFKSWFIDFEPFKNGKFIDSELGKIPEGWKVGSFSEVSDLLGGGTPKTTNNKFWNGTIPFFTPKDAIDIFVIETDRLITKEGLENCNTKLYPKGTIFITARGTVGKISLSGIEMAMNQSCYAIMPKHNIPTLFLYYQTVLLVKKLKNKASGAVFDAITTRDFDEAIIIPPLPIMNKFSETIERIFGAILNNIIQAKVLLKARDTLLPKLISGEIHVLDSNL